MEIAANAGRDIYEEFPWMKDEPRVQPGDNFYITAFYQLSTCRDYSMGIGPLPYDKVIEYAARAGLDEDMSTIFEYAMSAMDQAFLKWKSDEMKG